MLIAIHTAVKRKRERERENFCILSTVVVTGLYLESRWELVFRYLKLIKTSGFSDSTYIASGSW
jgi:hypothetical protein